MSAIHAALDKLEQQGFVPLATMPDQPYAIAKYVTASAHLALKLGQQKKGFVYLIDLDQKAHKPEQNATRALATFRAALPFSLQYIADEARPSTNGTGRHIIFKTNADLGIPDGTYIVLDGIHAGELKCAGHVPIPGDDPAIVLHAPRVAYDDALKVAHALGINLQDIVITARSDDMAMGRSLAAGYEYIRSDIVHAALNELQQFAPFQENLKRLHAASKGERSSRYASMVQSLALHIHKITSIKHGQRWQHVMALALAIGAAGKEKESTYKQDRDTHALIGKIARGAPIGQKSDRRFICPAWHRTGPRQQIEPEPQPEPRRAPGRPAGSQAKMIEKCYKLLEGIEPDEFGRKQFLVASLAGQLKCSNRSIQNYLKALRNKEKRQAAGLPWIEVQQIGGNGRAYVSCFRGANNCQETSENASKRSKIRGANESEVCGAGMPQSTIHENHTYKEDHDHQKSAPRLADLPAPTEPATAAITAPADEAAEVAAPAPGAPVGAQPFGALLSAPDLARPESPAPELDEAQEWVAIEQEALAWAEGERQRQEWAANRGSSSAARHVAALDTIIEVLRQPLLPPSPPAADVPGPGTFDTLIAKLYARKDQNAAVANASDATRRETQRMGATIGADAQNGAQSVMHGLDMPAPRRSWQGIFH